MYEQRQNVLNHSTNGKASGANSGLLNSIADSIMPQKESQLFNHLRRSHILEENNLNSSHPYGTGEPIGASRILRVLQNSHLSVGMKAPLMASLLRYEMQNSFSIMQSYSEDTKDGQGSMLI